MTLAPDTRVLLSDALRPPAGYTVDLAVGTTYSLNLTALLLAPLSFALHDHTGEGIDEVDPVRVLEAVRRYAESTTVFCQAGAIHVPKAYHRILAFVEDAVIEVMPPREGAIFHPKVWALRFVNEADQALHRVVILSRNLTFDRSWDTALVLDEQGGAPLDAQPMGDFLRRLPDLVLRRPMPEARLRQVHDLAASLSEVQLAVPESFREGQLVPSGLGGTTWPFPEHGKRLLAISPFLTSSAVSALAGIADERTLISRPAALEGIGSERLDGWVTKVLQPLVESEDPSDGEDAAEETAQLSGFLEVREGLHAKTFVVDLTRGKSVVITGSANLTSYPWGGNVEFDCVLTGPTRLCGVDAVLAGKEGAPGLDQVLMGFNVESYEGESDEALETAYRLEAFHQALASSGPELRITSLEGGEVTATLELALPTEPVGSTTLWPASLKMAVFGMPLESSIAWQFSADRITPFIAIETTAGEGPARATRSCVIKAQLVGDVPHRRQDAVFAILASKEAVLRYLLLLLGDPRYESLLAAGMSEGASERWTFVGPSGSAQDIALFEPLVRAIGRDGAALARVASLMDELRARPEGQQLVPEGFDELWDVVWSVHEETGRE